MSRSYKHYPCSKDGGRSKKHDRTLANRKIRRTTLDEVSNGGHYKKFTCRYDIYDYKWVETLNEYLEKWGDSYLHDDMMGRETNNWYCRTLQDAKLRWKKYYFFK